MPTTALRLALMSACAAALGTAQAAPGSACSATSGASVPRVVELYTSEGCSSCPPADRWLSGLKGRSDVVALAFHVDYWDRLGWKDRFGSPEHTRRQAALRDRHGARFVYTPQVVVDGRDWPGWHRAPLEAAKPQGGPPVALALRRDGAQVHATVQAPGPQPLRLAASWVVTESGHASQVKAGENSGATLHHDFVVRELLEVPAWDARPGVAVPLRFAPAHRAAPGAVVNLVVVDAATGQPVQALALGC